MTTRTIACLLAVGGLFLAGPATCDDSAYEDLLVARKAFDDNAFTIAHERLLTTAGAQNDNYAAQLSVAESFRLWATRLRNQRNIGSLEGKVDKDLRRKQGELAAEGMVFANRALELAKGDAQSAQAHRVIGELYSHQITGMISGMRNGPKAKAQINLALDLAPNDPECLRAISIMYLYNPPISGGDVPRAIVTFTKCSALAPESDIYPVLLAMAHRKAKDPESARTAANHALDLNPLNKDAQALLNSLDAE